jgi:hypothetical protein
MGGVVDGDEEVPPKEGEAATTRRSGGGAEWLRQRLCKALWCRPTLEEHRPFAPCFLDLLGVVDEPSYRYQLPKLGFPLLYRL